MPSLSALVAPRALSLRELAMTRAPRFIARWTSLRLSARSARGASDHDRIPIAARDRSSLGENCTMDFAGEVGTRTVFVDLADGSSRAVVMFLSAAVVSASTRHPSTSWLSTSSTCRGASPNGGRLPVSDTRVPIRRGIGAQIPIDGACVRSPSRRLGLSDERSGSGAEPLLSRPHSPPSNHAQFG